MIRVLLALVVALLLGGQSQASSYSRYGHPWTAAKLNREIALNRAWLNYFHSLNRMMGYRYR